ncbi:GNAT family N-acetyltransferase [Heliobacterium gestii]|uniref:GNAT family N-acetyltransferase n=1 Tax=Heliomicrobium gestii TaxID=2699 RepID=A0A845LHK6_HELGE|nr:GNAT family N-acetyltransferase [Heliomicrobium gestii]MBM7868309.1 ribosomal protein S18 acetylase RimI-like enzyme [Heliomicrobium gestii]MZP44500.1 GNAT family N-acetyltransferase [Heliomicrobium gestii]
MNTTLRPVEASDDLFLFQIFISSRPDLDWITGIDEASRARLLRQQFFAEEQGNADAERYIVLLKGAPIGRLYMREDASSIHIRNLALLPEYRNQGIGSRLLRSMMERAVEARKPVRFSVMWFNGAARALYERLAFRVVQDTGVCCEMEWHPPLA